MAKVEAKEKDKGGRPPEYDWDSVKAYALGLVREHGMPGRVTVAFAQRVSLLKQCWTNGPASMTSNSPFPPFAAMSVGG
jgi:hypothetical protein